MGGVIRWIDHPVLLRAIFTRWPRTPRIFHFMFFIIPILILGFALLQGRATRPQDSNWLPYCMNGAFYALYFAQCVILFLAGTRAITGAIAREREGGVFDLVRVSPQHPLRIVGGYVFGTPFMEHVMAFLLMPFAAIAVFMGTLSTDTVLVLYQGLYISAVCLHSLAVVVGLTMRDLPGAANHMTFIVIAIHTVLAVPFLDGTVYAIIGETLMGNPGPSFLGVRMPAVFLLEIIVGVNIVFLWIAAARRIRSMERPALSRNQGLLLYLLLQGILIAAHFESTLYVRSLSLMVIAGFLMKPDRLTMTVVALPALAVFFVGYIPGPHRAEMALLMVGAMFAAWSVISYRKSRYPGRWMGPAIAILSAMWVLPFFIPGMATEYLNPFYAMVKIQEGNSRGRELYCALSQFLLAAGFYAISRRGAPSPGPRYRRISADVPGAR